MIWSLKDRLINHKSKIGVFGCGYIGYTTMAYFANAGVKCIGYDIDPKKVEKINSGEPPYEELKRWIPFDVKPLTEEGLIKATLDYRELLDETVNPLFIAVPTERNSEPWYEPLKDVVDKISKRMDDPLVIIESTLAVGTVDKIVAPKLKRVVVAPRRDWFISPDKNLKTLPRIVGGIDRASTLEAISVLSIVCDKLIPATHREAELVKAVENAFRHLEAVFAQQLTLAYPDLNIRKVLELAGTKWNVNTMYPNAFGTGGYCIPLSSRYVLQGAKKPEELTLLKEAIATDDSMAKRIAERIKGSTIACLGLSYKENIKVHVLSPVMRLLKYVKDKSRLKIHDPLYTPEEVKKITGCEYLDFPKGLEEADVVLLMTGHDYYKRIPHELLIEYTKHCKYILDNTGIWKGIGFQCMYILVGEKNWLLKLTY